jgi:adhesin/invasin
MKIAQSFILLQVVLILLSACQPQPKADAGFGVDSAEKNIPLPSSTFSTITGTSSITANGVATSTITITLLDDTNLPVAGSVPTFIATDTGGTNSYGSCSMSNTSGVSTCSLTSTKAESKTLEITFPISVTGSSVTFVSGPAHTASSSISATSPVAADGSSTSDITITLLDAFNNPVSGESVTVTSSGSNNTLSCGTSDASGIALCTLSSTSSETKTIDVTAPVTLSTTSVFSSGAASSALSSFSASGPVVANGTSTSTISVTILDGNSNPLAGETVTISSSGTGNTLSSCSVTNGSGVSTCTLASTKAETKTLTMTAPVNKTTTVTFIAGSIASATSSITGTSSITANGTSTSTVTITLLDANSNPVTGSTPTFSATDTGSTNVYGACTVGDALGVSTCTLASTKAETKTLSIATPVVKAGGSVTFVAGAASATTSTIVASGGPVVADGTSTATITITLLDANSNPISGSTPAFTATNTGTRNTYGTCSASNSSGVSTCTLASTYAQSKTVSLTTPSVTGNSIVFTSGGINLWTPIEMTARYLCNATTVVTFNTTRTPIDTTNYDGDSITYTWEIDAFNREGTMATMNVELLNSAGTTVATIPVTYTGSGAGAFERFEVDFTPTTGSDYYRVRVPANGSLSRLCVGTSRIIVKQVKAKKTKIYIPLFSSIYFATGDTTLPVFSSTNTTYTETNFGARWKYDSSDFADIASGNAFTFDAVIQAANAGATAYATLSNKTDGTDVAASEVSVTGTTATYVSASFAANATNFDDLDDFNVKIKTSNASYNAHIYKAGVWITLNNLTKLETFWKMRWGESGISASTTQCLGKFRYSSSAWSNPTAYLEASHNASSTINNYYFTLTDTGTSDSSRTGTNLTTKLFSGYLTRTIERVSLSLTDTSRYCVYNGSTGFISGNTHDFNNVFTILAAEQ